MNGALTVREYLTRGGRNPFREWLLSLDGQAAARVRVRVRRFELGNLGDHKRVGKGIWEARVMFGPGYRIYFGKDGESIVLLLGGGSKATQASDIARAAWRWSDYMKEADDAET